VLATAATSQPVTAPIPDFAGIWVHPTLPGFEPPLSGPGPVRNRSRSPNGVGNFNQLVGDYTNPILKPEAAAIVKQHGDQSLAGIGYPTPSNQCWPGGVPYVFWNIGMRMFQKADEITILYQVDHEVRHVRMNQPHPVKVTPSWYGDSVGHFEGDTLVIDTVGIKVGPYAMLDWYGTPHTPALHVVERYRLLDYERAKDGLERDAKENFQVGQNTIDPNYKGKHLQLEFTVEDKGVFAMPWTATIVYGSGNGWLSLDPMFGSDGANVRVYATPGNLAPGTYNATITFDAGPNGGSQIVQVSYTVTAATPTTVVPSITSAVNAASFAATPMVPGSLSTLMGKGFAGKNLAATFDGVPSTILFSNDTQINLMVPVEMTSKASADLVVSVDGAASQPKTVNLAPFSPAILGFVRRFNESLSLCRAIYRKFQPNLVLGMGGFTSTAPVLPSGESGASNCRNHVRPFASRAVNPGLVPEFFSRSRTHFSGAGPGSELGPLARRSVAIGSAPMRLVNQLESGTSSMVLMFPARVLDG
jgi:hypothetical protein